MVDYPRYFVVSLLRQQLFLFGRQSGIKNGPIYLARNDTEQILASVGKKNWWQTTNSLVLCAHMCRLSINKRWNVQGRKESGFRFCTKILSFLRVSHKKLLSVWAEDSFWSLSFLYFLSFKKVFDYLVRCRKSRCKFRSGLILILFCSSIQALFTWRLSANRKAFFGQRLLHPWEVRNVEVTSARRIKRSLQGLKSWDKDTASKKSFYFLLYWLFMPNNSQLQKLTAKKC